MQFYYKMLFNRTSIKPVDIYCGTEKMGVVQGNYKNFFFRIMDQMGEDKKPFIGYELRDASGEVRLWSESPYFFGLRKIQITYFDNENVEHKFLMKDMKLERFYRLNKISFEYKGDVYYLQESKLFNSKGRYELIYKENKIADWTKPTIAKEVVINISDPDFYNEKYLIIGIMHAYLYPVAH